MFDSKFEPILLWCHKTPLLLFMWWLEFWYFLKMTKCFFLLKEMFLLSSTKTFLQITTTLPLFYTNKTKGSCGIPQMFWMLIPSHFITNPRTWISDFFLTFLGFVRFFPIPLETIKCGGDSCFLLWVELINNSISSIFGRYRKVATLLGNTSLRGLSLFCLFCVYYYCCIILFAWLCVLFVLGFCLVILWWWTSPTPGLKKHIR